MLRTAKLSVSDEIENALSYYHATFLRQIPRLYREVERALGRPAGSRPSSAWASGSAATATATPFVTAPETLQMALRRQARRCCAFYLTEVHLLGSELSISAMLAPVTPAMRALAERSPTTTSTASTSPTAAR